MPKIPSLLLAILLSLTLAQPTVAQSTQEIQAEVMSIPVNETVDGIEHVIFTAQDKQGSVYTVDSADAYINGVRFPVHIGQEVLLQQVDAGNGSPPVVFLIDVIRWPALLWIAGLFACLTLLIGAMRGGLALAGLGITMLMLFGYILPQILGGADPVRVTILGSLVILGVNMHLSHGFNKRTFYGLMSATIGLALVWVSATLFVWLARLSGSASEHASLLFLTVDTITSPGGLLLAGIILGAVGVLDDIVVTQTETVEALKRTDPSLTQMQLFSRAMHIGRHHIASVVNTLVLAYAGVAMPLFLLFLLREDMHLLRFLNEELIAEEIIRTLAGTMALILLVPISTWMATLLYKDGARPAPTQH